MPRSEANRWSGRVKWGFFFIFIFIFLLVSQISLQIAAIINSPFAISWLWFADSALFMAAHEKPSAFCPGMGFDFSGSDTEFKLQSGHQNRGIPRAPSG